MIHPASIPPARSGRYIPWLLGGAFAFSLAVNGVMTWMAVTSHPGLWTEHPYEKGLAHNDVLRAAAHRDAAGWQVRTLGVRDGSIHVDLLQADGSPLLADAVNGHLRHPIRSGSDLALELRPEGAGRWMSGPDRLPTGQWELDLDIRAGDDRLQVSRRLVLP